MSTDKALLEAGYRQYSGEKIDVYFMPALGKLRAR